MVASLLLAGALVQEFPRSVAARAGGEIDLRWVLRQKELGQGVFALNNGGNPFVPAGSPETVDFFLGRLNLWLEGTVSEEVSWRLQLRSLPRSPRTDVPVGNGLFDGVIVEQAYAETWFDPAWMLRAGMQGLRLQNRPAGIGEPFFLDLAEAESFFGGVTFPPPASAAPPALTTAVRNTVERLGSNPAGVRLRFDPHPLAMMEAFALNVAESPPGGLPVNRSEYLLGIHSSVAIPEDVSTFLVATFHSGPYRGARLFTVGAGADLYVDDARTLELFAEAYGQLGRLIDESGFDVEKEAAWAAQAGVRRRFGDFWIEASYWHLTGDQNPADGSDQAFQSYENVDQFLVLEDDEIGLDLDTNYRAVKLSAASGLGPGLLSEGDLMGRVDVGWFRLDEPLVGVFGTRLTGRDDLGIEVDGSVVWQAHEQLDFRLRAGWLLSSGVLEAITPSGRSGAYALTVGMMLRF
jgi:hypothetical protein